MEFSVIAIESIPVDLSGIWTKALAQWGRIERRERNQMVETETSYAVLGAGHRGTSLYSKAFNSLAGDNRHFERQKGHTMERAPGQGYLGHNYMQPVIFP